MLNPTVYRYFWILWGHCGSDTPNNRLLVMLVIQKMKFIILDLFYVTNIRATS